MDYYNVNTIEPDQRDSFGQYMIQPNTVTIFPFSIPLLQGLKLSAVHIYPNSQDFSIDMWITSQPLDGLQLFHGFNHFKPSRRTTEFLIFDSFLKKDQYDHRLFLPSGQTFYLNVKNLQNRINAFQLYLDNFTITP